MNSLENKTVLITGSTGGIGRSTATLMAREGASVIVSGRNVERGQAVVTEITAAGGKARFVAADLADSDDLARLASEAADADVLVNNAAIFPMGPTADQPLEDFDAAFAANVRAPYVLTAALAPKMSARGGGSIVNISTMAAEVGMAGLSVYSATKGALNALTRSWAAEFAGSGVRVNTVAPGPTGTDMVLDNMGEEAAAAIASTTLLQRLATPEEIAEVVTFIASDRAAYITGATVPADGGRTAI